MPLFRATIVLADLAAVLPDWPALAALPPAELAAALTARYHFLHPEVAVTVEGGLARLHCPAPSPADEETVRDRTARATALARRGDYLKAIPLFAEALRLDPTAVATRRDLAMAYAEAGRLESALGHVREALLLAPRDPWSLVLLGNTLLRQGELERAEAAFAQAHREAPDDPYVLNAYAVLALRRNRPGEARQRWEAAIAAAPESPHPYLGLAQLALAEGQPLAALEALDRLFRRGQGEDVRAAPLYAEAERLYHEASARAAEAGEALLRAAVEARRAELALLTGHPIEIREDAALPVRATVRFAWVHGTPTHAIVHRPLPAAELPHVLMAQLEQIARDHEARRAGKARALVADPRTRRIAQAALARYAKQLGKRGVPEAKVRAILDQLVDGVLQQLVSSVLEMLVEYRLYRSRPELRPSQFVSLHASQVQNRATLGNAAVHAQMPPAIVRASLAMNAAFALFEDWLLAPRTRYADAYREHEAFDAGRRVFELWADRLATLAPGDEYEVVDRVARELGLEGWYGWRDEPALAEAAQPEGPSDPELLRRRDPATLWYCLDALKLFADRSPREVEAIATEIALLGQSGIDYSTPEKQYTLRALPGRTFSGLQLLALMYVGFRQARPELTDLGIDLAGPYEAALKLFAGEG